jgi:hypothetical protein
MASLLLNSTKLIGALAGPLDRPVFQVDLWSCPGGDDFRLGSLAGWDAGEHGLSVFASVVA